MFTIFYVSLFLSLGIFLLSRRHYASGLLLGVYLIPVYLLRHAVAGVPTNAWEMIVAATLLAGAAQPEQRRAWQAALRTIPRLLAASVAAFLLAAAISTAISAEPHVSLGILKGWIVVPLLFAGLLYAQLRREPGLRDGVLAALLASGLSVAALALFMDSPSGRLTGPYDVPNSLALYLAPLAAAALWQSLRRPRAAVSALLLFAALAATQSLAGMIAPLLAVAAARLLRKARGVPDSSPDKGRQRGVQSALLIGLILLIAALGAWDKIAYLRSDAPTSLDVRRQLWSIGWELAREQPLLGVGLGQYEPAYQQKLHERFQNYSQRTPLPEFVFRDPHAWPLAFHLNTGLLGLAAFAALNAWLLQQARPPAQLIWAVMLLAILIHGLVETIYFKNDLAALYWAAAAIIGANAKQPNSPQPD